MLNPAYAVDHHYHHMWVGTEKDAATARRGQTVFRFIVQMESMSWSHAVQASSLRSGSQAGMLPFVPGCDRFLNGIAISFISLLMVSLTLGIKALALYVAGSVLATVFLDAANYMEHYGLVRHVGRDGELEPIGFQHSWDSTHLIGNLLFFQVGGHAAHHMQGSLPYPELDLGRGPVLPYGLVTMTVMAFFPRVFFNVVHPVLDSMAAESTSS
jgi:alkane 1-monooxygenase